MEEKKTFGAFILRRRCELGMTQKEFAQKLYVTESAVSKWERGLSYPDITLLREICAVLEISEHELLTGDEDTERRASERLAAKYLKLARSFRRTQYVLYGATLIGCLIGNLCAQGRLDWFWIALAAVLTGASLTLLPAILSLYSVQNRAPVVWGSFIFSLETLLLACCVYTGGNWFGVAAAAVLLGLTLVLLPFLLRRIPLPDALYRRRESAYLLLESALLILLLHVCAVYSKGDWFLMAAISTLFGLGFFILPVFFRQIPLPKHRALAYFALQTIGLVAVLLVADRYSGADVLWQVSIPIAAISCALPWGIMLCACYIPANKWLKSAAACLLSALWLWLWPVGIDRILTPRFGPNESGAWPLFPILDWQNWDGQQAGYNVFLLILLVLLASSAIMGAIGIKRHNTDA